VRPVNLIPEGERRRRGGAGRTGPLVFILLGALALALAGVVLLVTTSNQVSERESELTSLQARTVAAQTRADRLAPFAEFNEVKEQRTETISELADNRFDWARVLHELSLVMPRWVILTEIAGSAGAGSEGGERKGVAQSIEGPAIGVSGCAKSQTRVAQMVAAMKQIDGVTRVGLTQSARVSTESSGGGKSSSGGPGCDPGTVAFAAFAAFDAAPLPVEASEASALEAAEPEASESSESGGEAEGESGTEETSTTNADGSTTKVTTEAVPPES
jgi:Tfp pilus assembly protein PilN